MTEPRSIGIAQLAIVHAPDQLVCLGLGSCVAIVVYDPGLKTGGIVHVLLPRAPPKCDVPEKYADSGVKKLIKELLSHGTSKGRLVAKLVGGAQMFSNLNLAIANIGRENVMEARKTLHEQGVKIVAEELYGSRGRSAVFDSSTGKVTVRTAFGNTRVI